MEKVSAHKALTVLFCCGFRMGAIFENLTPLLATVTARLRNDSELWAKVGDGIRG
jgi:hypothetical protein